MTLFELELPKAYESKYLALIKGKLVDRITNGLLYQGEHKEFTKEVKEILIPNWSSKASDTSKIERLLIAEPEELVRLNDDINAEIEKLDESLRPKDKEIEIIFGYEIIFNTKSKSKAYKLALEIGANTCCYCNRQYTFTVVRNGNKNKEDRLTRPAFDHWFPKSKFPLLSVSLYNLIPSCTVCNSSAKGDNDVNLHDYIHPYVHRPQHPKIKFVAVPATEPDRNWTLKIVRKKNSPEDKTIKMFYLDEIYKEHDKLELKDLMDFRDNYSDGYLKDLMQFLIDNKMDDSSLTREDVYRMIFGIEWNDDKHLDRPFGKMKNDILKEIIN